MNDSEFECSICGWNFDKDTDLHDAGNGRNVCGSCFDNIVFPANCLDVCELCGTAYRKDQEIVICKECGNDTFEKMTKEEWIVKVHQIKE